MEQIIEKFWLAVLSWQQWVQNSLLSENQTLEKIRDRFAQRCDLNLYRDRYGRVWKHSGNYCYRLARNPCKGRYGEYIVVEKLIGNWIGGDPVKLSIPQEGIKENLLIELTERATYDSDWAWEECDPIDSTLGYYHRTQGSSALGLVFAQRILEQKDQINKWMVEYAPTRDRHNLDDCHDDWMNFKKKFVPDMTQAEIPDSGEMHCCLSAALDFIATGKELRVYCS